MDFLDFDGRDLYFDSRTSEEVEELIHKASVAYPEDEAELYLLRCYFYEPDNLSVHVSLYRYYYYKHDYQSALKVAERTLEVAGKNLGYNESWRELSLARLSGGVMVSMGLTRYYLLGLKASAYLLMRLEDLKGAVERLEKVHEMDPADQFGIKDLLAIAKRRMSDIEIEKRGSGKVSIISNYR